MNVDVKGTVGGGCKCSKQATCVHREEGAFSMKGKGRRAMKVKNDDGEKSNKKRKRYGGGR